MTCTTLDLAAELNRRDYTVNCQPADPPHVLAASVNIWLDRLDRYPFTTIYAPVVGVLDDGWLWGPNYEHSAPSSASVSELADLVVASLPANGDAS